MAAAYAACNSLSHIIDQILRPPPTHHFDIPREQIERLKEQVDSFISFLETYSNRSGQEIEDLEKRIVGAAYKAEDIIESFVVAQIQAKYKTHSERKSSVPFLQSLQKEKREDLPIQKVMLKKKYIVGVANEFISIWEDLDQIRHKKGVEHLGSENTKNIVIGIDELIKIRRFRGVEDGKLEKSYRKLKQMFSRRNEAELRLSAGKTGLDKTKFFRAQELAQATDDFNHNRVVGMGGYGNVDKGMLPDGRIVTIKKVRITDEFTEITTFIYRVIVLSQIKHRNVAELLGCCLETEAPLLVYEFVNNGTLGRYIHDPSENFRLTWEMRLRIAREAAGALAYLHSGISQHIYHGDITSSHIVLDHKYQPKITDFELLNRVNGTFGYVDPEYLQSGEFTKKSDVYSFGVVMAELLTGEKPIMSSIGADIFQRKLATHFLDSMKKDRLFQILDARVLKVGNPEDILAFAGIARRCLHFNGGDRPTMMEVSVELEGIHIVEEQMMIGFDEHLTQIRTQILTACAAYEFRLQIIPVVGMGGIGKTTLAKNVYNDAYIIEHFDVRAWVSISQEYVERDIIAALLQQINRNIEVNQLSADELRNLLYRELFGRRYFIVLDDIWDIKAWDMLRMCLPYNSVSRILVTTRLSNLARCFKSCTPYQLCLLNNDSSWALILEHVFGKEECSNELKEIGKNIARKCGGLPLALVLIGSLLAKSEKTVAFWEYVHGNVTSAVDHSLMQILRLSYSELPVHLKPCFLYLAVFPEEFEIPVSRLIRLWVAEGFIKPTGYHSLEEMAESNLNDLVDRNLIIISKRGSNGKTKKLSIHNFIRHLCMAEAEKNKFLCVAKIDASNNSPPLENERRLSIHASTEKEKVLDFKAGAQIRSFLSYSGCESERAVASNLLRVLDAVDFFSIDEILQLFNSRYITCGIPLEMHVVPSSISLLWNLQTLVVSGPLSLPSEIWQMPQLRHLKIPGITLPEPLEAQGESHDIIVLENLQTLSTVKDFIFKEHVLKRIPNLEKLGIDCKTTEIVGSFCLTNIASFQKLESLDLALRGTWEKMAFPVSLKKLTLRYCQIPWEDMSVVGSLPNLEVLKLRTHAAKGQRWNPNAGEFCRLKFLLIEWCQLEIWEADYTNFQSLEHLQLEGVRMEEFPMDFADITLQTINLRYCSKSLLFSAYRMSEERENNGCEAIYIESFPKEAQLPRGGNLVNLADEEATLIKYLNEETDELDVISIVGMPGLGKTTLAWKIYCDPKIQYEFPTLIWVYVSQEFNVRNVFLAILKNLTHQDMSSKEDHKLAQIVRSRLENVRFLLFMDDVWTFEHWKQIEAALPKNNRFGKVLITSRHACVAVEANRSRYPHHLRFLNIYESWELLQLQVFGTNNDCPPEFEWLGKQIAIQCGGVPLAVVLIGGILVENCVDREELWKKVLHDMSVDLQDGVIERMENIISLTYNMLPNDLRDCFLYLRIFPEDAEIPAWKLTRLWIAEEFIQHNQGKSLEEIAEDNLNNLVARKLVMVEKTKANGGIKTCRVHDMIQEFCKNEAISANKNLFQEAKKMRQGVLDHDISRFCIHSNVMEFLNKKLPKGPNKVRSFLCFSKEIINLPTQRLSSILEAFVLLRVIDLNPINLTIFPSKLAKLIHLRYIVLSGNELNALPEAVSKLWNLQTVTINTMLREYVIKGDIGKMKELRYLKTKAAIVLKEVKGEVGENLHTLSRLSVKSCTKELFNRASNLKNLGIRGDLATLVEANFLETLDRLEKLKLVHDRFPCVRSESALHRLPLPQSFPPNLRILTLSSTFLDWMHMTTLGSLPKLEVLKLKEMAFKGSWWVAEGHGFPCLESLHIARTDLKIWTASDDPFPKLRNLILQNCEKLQEIPSLLGKTLQLVEIERVTPTLVLSAKKIKAEKEEMQGGKIGGKEGGFILKISPEMHQGHRV